MAVEGSLDLFRLPEILQVISQETKTGILTIQGEEDIVAISFLRGKVVAADGLNATVERSLGDVLDREGLLSRERYQAALEEQRKGGGRLVDVLVSRGFLARAQLLRALRRQTEDLLRELLRWRKGDFKFYSGDEVSFEEGFEPILVEDLLLKALEAEPPRAAPPAAPAATAKPRPAPAAGADPGAAAPPRPAAPPPADPRPAPVRPSAPTPAPRRPEPAPPPSEPRLPEAPRWENTPVREPTLELTPTRHTAILDAGEDEEPVRRAADTRATSLWLGRLVALAAAIGLVTGFFLIPTRLLLPYPWDAALRNRLEDSRHRARIEKVEGALRSYYLLEGRLPEDLGQLIERGYLSDGDTRGLQGSRLRYQKSGDSYQLVLGAPGLEKVFEGTIRGDVFLDPETTRGTDRSRNPPLVLLD
jgi:hypothetical protein